MNLLLNVALTQIDYNKTIVKPYVNEFKGKIPFIGLIPLHRYQQK